MEDVRGVRSRHGTCAHRGDREPRKQANEPARGDGEAPANPLRIAAIFSQKALGQAARAGEQNRCFGNRRSPLIDADTLDLAGYRIVATQRIRLQLQSRIPRTLAIFQSPLAIF
jgi:hypothetical protein